MSWRNVWRSSKIVIDEKQWPGKGIGGEAMQWAFFMPSHIPVNNYLSGIASNCKPGANSQQYRIQDNRYSQAS
jgi:hypothetical protein